MMLGLDVLIAVVVGTLAGVLVAYAASLLVGRKAKKYSDVIALIAQVQSRFLNDGDAKTAFYTLLDEMVTMTGSDYGYIAEVHHDEYGGRYLKTRALLDASWAADARDNYRAQDLGGGMEFHDLKNILASVLTAGGVVVNNDVKSHERGKPGQEIRPIDTFIGLPVFVGQRLVAVVGLANRPTGYDNDQEQDVTPLLATVGQVLDNCIITAEKEAVESRFETTKALVDGSNDAIILWANGVFIDCNRATEALFQCTKEQFIGKSPSDFSPAYQADGSDSREKALSYIKLVESGQPQRFLWQHITLMGEVFTAEVCLNCIGGDGNRKIFAGVLRDVTEQERNRKKMEEQKTQLELVLEGTAAGIWDWDIQNEQITFNERWANIIGYTLAEIAPAGFRAWKSACHPDDLAASELVLKEYLAGVTDRYTSEMRMRHKNGSWVWVLDTGKVVSRNPAGEPIRMVGTHIDIDHIKRSEARAEFASVQLKNFFDLSQDFMCVANLSGHFEKVNNTFIKTLGYTESELLQQPFLNFVHLDDYEKTMDQLLSLADGNFAINFRNRFRKCGGEYITLQWTFTPDPNSNRVYASAFDVTDDEKAEQELRTLSRIAKEVRNGVVITDCHGRVTWVNQAFERMSGYHLDEILGQIPKDFLQGEQTDKNALLKMHNALVEQRAFRTEIINYHKDGGHYWVDIDCSPMFDDNGCLQGFMAIEADITEQKYSAMELERQQSLLEQMSEIGCIGAWEANLLTKEVFWSAITRSIHEVDDDFQPTLDTAINFYKEGESRNSVSEVVGRAMEAGESWQIELQLITAKGREIWVSSTGKAIFANGQCVKLLGSFQDIDERKRHQITHQQAVVHNQALAGLTLHEDVLTGDLKKAAPTILTRCAEALQVSRASIWLFDEGCTALECVCLYESDTQAISSGAVLNKSDYPEYFQFLFTHSILSAGDAKNHPGSSEFRDDYLQPLGIVSMLDGVISGGESFVGVVCIEHVDSRRDWSAAEEAFVGTIATIVSSVVDREQRRKTEQVLITAIDAANAAAQAKSDFLASMSHEIRTPMNGVLGMLGLVLKTELNTDQQRKVSIALNSAQSLLTIINDILDFSKIEAGKLVMESMSFNLNALLAETAETMSFRAEEHRLELMLNLSAVSAPYVIGDPGRLRQVLTNLVGNALKFTHKGEIVISAETIDEANGGVYFICHVKDTGIGIPAEKQADLFDAFTQVDASNTRRYGGTGLGLSIVKKLCKAMGGRVWVNSVPDQGSCFSFKILLQKDNRPELVLPNIDLTGRKILVVDDNATNREIVAEQLLSWGVDAYLASDANDAVALCADNVSRGLFDIALLDMQMPGIDGATLGKTLKADPRYQKMPLVMMTSQAQRGDAAEFAALGFAGYFPKPVNPSVLLNAIKVILDGSALPHASPLVTRHFLENLESGSDNALPNDQCWPPGSRILLVEDNTINQEVAVDLLRDIGLIADVAADGQEAVLALAHAPAAHPYKLVLMDCQMPVMDGFAAAKAIRRGEAGEANRNVTIIAMTANALKGDKERCLNAGMNDYLPKPIDTEALDKALRHWLGGEDRPASASGTEAQESIASNVGSPEVSVPKLAVSTMDVDCGASAVPDKSNIIGLKPSAGTPIAHFSTEDRPTSAILETLGAVSDSANEKTVKPLEQKIDDLQAAIWDLAGALKRVRGRPERLISLIHSYSEQSPEMISDLYQKIESNDLAEAATLCHTLRGVAGNLGGTQIMVAAQALESCCKDLNHDEAERLVGELLVSNNDFLSAIQGYQH